MPQGFTQYLQSVISVFTTDYDCPTPDPCNPLDEHLGLNHRILIKLENRAARNTPIVTRNNNNTDLDQTFKSRLDLVENKISCLWLFSQRKTKLSIKK